MLQRTDTQPIHQDLRRPMVAALIAGLVLLFLVVTILIVPTQNGMRNSDFYSFWLSGRVVRAGGDVYNLPEWESWRAEFDTDWIHNRYRYPLPLAFLYIPLSLLDYPAAIFVALLLYQVCILVSILLILTTWQKDQIRPYLIPLILGVMVLRPVFVTLYFGQMGAVLLLVCALAAYLWRKQRWFWGGFLLAVLLVKPNIGVPMAGLMALWALCHRRWSAFLGMAASSLLLLVPTLLYDPQWIAKFFGHGDLSYNNVAGFMPTLWGFAASISAPLGWNAGMLGSILMVLASGAAVAIVLVYRKTLNPWSVMSISIPTALLIAPYLWAYDHILLIVPLVYMMGLLVKHKYPFLVPAMIPVLAALVSHLLVLIAIQIGYDIWSFLLPLFVLVVVLIYQKKLAWISDARTKNV